MQIVACNGIELEKEKPNTSEDFFNQSEISYVDKGQEHSLRVLYVRYFETNLSQFTPFETDPILTLEYATFFLRDIVALVALIKYPEYKNRKRVYINHEDDFNVLFEGIKWDNLKQVLVTLSEGKRFDLESTLEFIQG
ncbi:hypothetical protein GLW08_17245 [Pontibacillus yanchengensis]|uniref:Uncharacterized protein n=2 Tax=Pontibacillus yanchengensis TaxID=462910 RepID=A0ACC7VJY2_9BACI|nr:hypothetical protein [Pontibacillus yanchengensis]MYL32688.1 hypothetical protein [Pontibacillus yanchengensis]MYL55082.1 hypothetical protein [Pontibacillus yanchengensis]